MLISNIEKLGSFIKIEPFDGEPRKVLSEILKKIDNDLVIISINFVGRRVINTENLHLLKGRRFRIYIGLKVNNKIYIKFGWHKIKNLNDSEMQFLLKNWKDGFFENIGKHLIEKSGGTLSYNNLLYTKTKIIS